MADSVEQFGRFALERRLGAGGMGEVWLATDTTLERRVAIKRVVTRLAATAHERLQREARAMARLAHPNIAVVYEVSLGEPGFVAMEYLAGGTLRAWQAGRPWREVVAKYVAAARGLAAAHRAGIVHRDFKAENVLLGATDEVKVADFGLAAELASREDEVAGTATHIAPERLADGTGDARADQFSFCVALWQAVTGRNPFDVDGEPRTTPAGSAATLTASRSIPTSSGPCPRATAELYAQAALDRRFAPPPRELPRRLIAILRRGLDADPARRFADMDVLADELVALIDRPRRRLMLGLVSALASAAVIAAVLVRGSGSKPSHPGERRVLDWLAGGQMITPGRDGTWFAVTDTGSHHVELLDDSGHSLSRLPVPDGLSVEALATLPEHAVLVGGVRGDAWEVWRIDAHARVLLGSVRESEVLRGTVVTAQPQLEADGDTAVVVGRAAIYRFAFGRPPQEIVPLDATLWHDSLRVSPTGQLAFTEDRLHRVMTAQPGSPPTRLVVPECDLIKTLEWLDARRLLLSCRSGVVTVEVDPGGTARTLGRRDRLSPWVWWLRRTDRGVVARVMTNNFHLLVGPIDGELHAMTSPVFQTGVVFGWLDNHTLAVYARPNGEYEAVAFDLRTDEVTSRLPLDKSEPMTYDGARALVVNGTDTAVRIIDAHGTVAAVALDPASDPHVVCNDVAASTCVLITSEGARQVIRRLDHDARRVAIGEVVASLPRPLPDSDPVFPELARDGRRLVVPRGRSGLVAIDVATGAIEPLADADSAFVQFARFEADGSRIETVKARSHDSGSELRRIAPDGTTRVLRKVQDGFFGYPNLSPDGRTLVVTELTTSYGLELLDLDLP